jgi:hypothetical protein
MVDRLVEISRLMMKSPNRMSEFLQSLQHGFIGYQPMRTQIDLIKTAKSLQMQSTTQARSRKNETKLQMND